MAVHASSRVPLTRQRLYEDMKVSRRFTLARCFGGSRFIMTEKAIIIHNEIHVARVNPKVKSLSGRAY